VTTRPDETVAPFLPTACYRYRIGSSAVAGGHAENGSTESAPIAPRAEAALTRPAPDESRIVLDRQRWIDEARDVLAAEGIAEIKIDALARRLGVTRGSFYWHFDGRDDLLAALLDDWRERAVAPFLGVVEESEGRPAPQRMAAIFEVWFDAARFDAHLESAMRDWARISTEVDDAVRTVDAHRVACLRVLFTALGHSSAEAEVRARITYFHQVGYYALRIAEPEDLRRSLLPIYFRVLTGVEMPCSTDQDYS
jgi:AcrR family transcriptional regulator